VYIPLYQKIGNRSLYQSHPKFSLRRPKKGWALGATAEMNFGGSEQTNEKADNVI
jgi:hypothetical protein